MAGNTRDIVLTLKARVDKAIDDLAKAEKRLDKLGAAAKKNTIDFGGLKTAVGGFISALALREVGQAVVEFTDLNAQTQALRRSFNVLSKKEGLEAGKLMAQLRESTAGTVSEIQLLQAATQAKFFGIDLQTLPTLFEFARKRAKDTGQDIDFLVKSIVTGIGRKSALILDNLGLQLKDLNDAVKEVAIENGTWTGRMNEATFAANLQAAAVNIAKRSIAESGKEIRTRRDDWAQFQADLENSKARVGELIDVLAGIGLRGINAFFSALNNGLDALGVGGARRLREITGDFTALKEQINGQNQSLSQLRERYNQLSINTTRSTAEQAELEKVMADIVKIVPAAASEIDEYGKVLGINTNVLDRFIKTQQALLRRTEADVFQNLQDEIRTNVTEFERLQKALADNSDRIDELSAKSPQDTFKELVRSGGATEVRIRTVGEELEKLDRIQAKNLASSEELAGQFDDLVFALASFKDLASISAGDLANDLRISEIQAAALLKRYEALSNVSAAPPPPPPPATDNAIKEEDVKRLEETLAKLRLENALATAEGELEIKRQALRAELEERRRAVADLVGVERAYLLEKEDLTGAIESRIASLPVEQRQTALDLIEELDRGYAAKRDALEREVADKRREAALTSAREIAELQTQLAVEGAQDEFEARRIQLEAEYQRERDTIVARIRERNADVVEITSEHFEELALLDEVYAQRRAQIERDAAAQRIDTNQAVAIEIGRIFENSFVALADSLADAATRGIEAWEDFFNDLKRQIVSFLASQAVKAFLNFVLNSLFPGSGNVFGGFFKFGVDGKAQSGAFIKGSPAGQIYQVGENNTDELIIPVRRFADFLQGRYALPGGFDINNLPVPNLAPNPTAVGVSRTIERTVERAMPIEGEIRLRTIAPEHAEVEDYYIGVNDRIIEPRQTYRKQFLRPGESEFD